jgi:putative transcriptional regulator
MTTKTRQANEIYTAVRQKLEALNEAGIDTKLSIRELDRVKLQFKAPPKYQAKDVLRIRKKLNVSQAVFAHLIASSKSTVQKWEVGDNLPSKAYSKLLELLDLKGVDALLV